MSRIAVFLPALFFIALTSTGPAQSASDGGATETRSVDEVIADQVFTDAFLNSPANVAAGKELWDGQCALCHGAKAYPGKAPKLKPRKYKPLFVFKRTYKGFKGMPAWREVFTIDEIRTMVAYIKSPGFAP